MITLMRQSPHAAVTVLEALVGNIIVWLDCYALMVSVLSSAYLEKFGQFMLYQKNISLASCRFIGEGWVIYDSSYRR